MAIKRRISRSAKCTVDSKGNKMLELHEIQEWVETSEPEETSNKIPWTATVSGILLLAIVGNWLTTGTEKAVACIATAPDCMAYVLADFHAVITSLFS